MNDREVIWAEAMKAGLRGDQRAYARLLGELAGVLRGILRGKLRTLSAADLEDLVQDVLLAIHNKRETWDQTRPLMPWVRAIAEHKLIDRIRQNRRSGRVFAANLSADDLAEVAPQPEPEFERAGLDVDKHLAALPERQRQIVKALTIEESSIAKVAKDLSMSEGAVRVALHRGLAALARRARGGHGALET